MDLDIGNDVRLIKSHLGAVKSILGGIVRGVSDRALEDPRLWAAHTRRAQAVREVLSAIERTPGYAPSEAKALEYSSLGDLVRLGDSLLQQQQLWKLSPPGVEPRQIQQMAFQRLIGFCQRAEEGGPRFPGGVFSTHLDCATGIGKTAFFLMCAAAAKRVEQRVVVFTPFVDLIDQTVREAKKFAPTLRVGWSYAGSCTASTDNDLVLVTYQGSNRACSGEFGKFSVGFLDEVHLALTPMRRSLPSRVPGLAVAIGLTGSPRYTEEKQVAKYFGPALLSVSLPQAIRMGQLAPMTTVVVRTDVKIVDPTIHASGELGAVEIDRLVRDDVRNKAIISILKSPVIQDSPHGTLVSCFNTEHVGRLMKLAEAEGLQHLAELHYKAEEDGSVVLGRCRTGAVKILFVVRKTIGLDLPNFKTLVNGRESFSEPDATQRAGRIARLYGDAIGLLIDILDRFETYGGSHPITGYQILGGEVLVPEERREDPAIKKRLGEIREAFEKLELPAGYEVLLTPEQLMKVLPEAHGPVKSRFSADEARQILEENGLDLHAIVYSYSPKQLADRELQSENPKFQGTFRSLLRLTDGTMVSSTQGSFVSRFSKLADDLFGDRYWEELRRFQFGEPLEGSRIERFIETCLTDAAPLGEVFTRPHVVSGSAKAVAAGKELARTGGTSFFGTDVLRLLGVSAERCLELELSERIPRELFVEICERYLDSTQRSKLIDKFDVYDQVRDILKLGVNKIPCDRPLWQLNSATLFTANFTHPNGFSRTGYELLSYSYVADGRHYARHEGGVADFIKDYLASEDVAQFGCAFQVFQRYQAAKELSAQANPIADRVFGVMRLVFERQLEPRLAEALAGCPADFTATEISIPGLAGEEFTLAELGFLAGSALRKANRDSITGVESSPQIIAVSMLSAVRRDIWGDFASAIKGWADERVSQSYYETSSAAIVNFDCKPFFGKRSITGMLLGLSSCESDIEFRARRAITAADAQRGVAGLDDRLLTNLMVPERARALNFGIDLNVFRLIQLRELGERIFRLPIAENSFALAELLAKDSAEAVIHNQLKFTWPAQDPSKMITLRSASFVTDLYALTMTEASDPSGRVLCSATIRRYQGDPSTWTWYIADIVSTAGQQLSGPDFEAAFAKLGEPIEAPRIIIGDNIARLSIRADLLVSAVCNRQGSSSRWVMVVTQGPTLIGERVRKLKGPSIDRGLYWITIADQCVAARLARVEARMPKVESHDWHGQPTNFWDSEFMFKMLRITGLSSALLDSIEDAVDSADYGAMLRVFREERFKILVGSDRAELAANSLRYWTMREIAGSIEDYSIVTAEIWRKFVEFSSPAPEQLATLNSLAEPNYRQHFLASSTQRINEFLVSLGIRPQSKSSVAPAAPTSDSQSALQPSAKLEINGPHFSPHGRLVLYPAESHGITYVHYTNKCTAIPAGVEAKAVVAGDIFSANSGVSCCKRCNAPQLSLVPKIEASYAKPQSRVNRTVGGV